MEFEQVERALYVELGRRVRDARCRRGLTQEGLGDLVSLTRTSVTNIEKGRQRLLVHTLVRIAAALKVSPASLLPDASDPAEELDRLLAGHPGDEKEWIRSAVREAWIKE